MKAFSERALPFFADPDRPALRPVIDSMFDLQDIGEAHKHMEANGNKGKIVVRVIPQNYGGE